MRKLVFTFSLLLILNQSLPALAANISPDATKNIQTSQSAVTPLSNQDILGMLKSGLAPEVLIAKIKSSACSFDTSPAALAKLKAEGAPDAVIVAMVTAPKDATTGAPATDLIQPAKKVEIKIPNATIVDLESVYTISSQDVREGDAISFRVVNPVKVNGETVIASGATATARVVKAERGGHFGRAGLIAWNIQEVTAVDGTRVPLQPMAMHQRGDSKGAKVATGMVLTGVLLGPFAPIALLHGFKRGENAFIPAGKRFAVFVQGDVQASITEESKR